MTKQSANRFGGGRSPDLRSSRGRHGIGILCLVVGLLASAAPAWAAEVVEVRIGRHPGFTRVVFELDRAAGYRIERSDPSQAGAGLVVSLDASSIPRKIDSGKALIEGVSVEPMGSRSVARVRLAKDGLRLKEMILTNPPRIVLDVLNDTPPAPAVAKAKAKTTAKPTVAKAKPVVVEQVVEKKPDPAASRKQAASPARKPVQQAAAAPTERTVPKPRAAAPRENSASTALAKAEAKAATGDGSRDGGWAGRQRRGFLRRRSKSEQSEPSSALRAAEALAGMGEPQERRSHGPGPEGRQAAARADADRKARCQADAAADGRQVEVFGRGRRLADVGVRWGRGDPARGRRSLRGPSTQRGRRGLRGSRRGFGRLRRR